MDDRQPGLPALLSREVMQRAIQEFARRGGRARAAKLSARRRREIAKTAVQARNRKLSKSRRQEIARQAVRARWERQQENQRCSLMAAQQGATYGAGSGVRFGIKTEKELSRDTSVRRSARPED